MIDFALRGVAAAVVAALLLVACGEGTPEPAEAPAQDGPAADDQAGDRPSVEDVLAEVADMGLTYEERLDYLYEKAQEEGAVLLYGSSNLEVLEGWAEGFQEAYPDINYLHVRQRSEDLYERVLAEARSQRHLVDVINSNGVIGAALYREGVIADHHGMPVPEGYPERYVDAWAAVSNVNPQVIAWNTNAISDEDAPREWDDLLRPEHAGCVIDVGSEVLVAGLILDRGYDGAEAWLQGFLDNGGVVRRGARQTAGALAAGEVDCAVDMHNFDIEHLIQDGAPLEWHAPNPTPAAALGIYIYEHTERPHAAALLMHWILSEDGAQVAASEGRVSVHPDVEISLERLQPWIVPGTDLEQRLLPVLPAQASEVDDQVLELLDTYLVPRLVGD